MKMSVYSKVDISNEAPGKPYKCSACCVESKGYFVIFGIMWPFWIVDDASVFEKICGIRAWNFFSPKEVQIRFLSFAIRVVERH